MTNEYEIADDSRENLIWTKEQLLAPLESGMEVPPHPMRLGDTERDYYRLGSAGVSAPRDQADRDAGPGPGGTPGEQRDEDDRRVAEVKWTPDARPGADTGGADQ